MSQVQPPLVVSDVGPWCVVEFKTASLMDTMELTRIADVIYPLVDQQGRRRMILDFSSVKYLSSQAIGILLNLNGKLKGDKQSKLVLCGVCRTLLDLIKITRLDRVLTIEPTLKDALAVTA